MICQAPFFPNRGNYTTDREHDGNQRKSWFLILRMGLFTKKVDTEFQAQTSGSPVLTFRTRAEAEAHWAANCREFHLHRRDNNNEEGSEEEGNDSSLPPSPPPSPTPQLPHRVRQHAVRSVKRKVHVSVKREVSAPLLVKEEPEAPLFREDGDISPLSRPRKHLTPPSPPSSRRRSTSPSAHSVSLRTPGPDASPSRASPPSTGMSTGSISSVSSLSASVPSSGSCAAPPLRSLQGHPRSSRPVAPYLHAGGWATAGAGSSASTGAGSSASTGAGSSASTGASSSASAATGVQSRRHAEPPVLFNNSTRTLYKDVATAVREMGKGERVQVLEFEDLEDFFSAPPHAAV
ncbi:hypothetical protein DFH09DRAFT_1347244 [Mycena vulgaris]|nr:hypothetical protein DFH09DRAFT_1347244 [Mycena vulgaris]